MRIFGGFVTVLALTASTGSEAQETETSAAAVGEDLLQSEAYRAFRENFGDVCTWRGEIPPPALQAWTYPVFSPHGGSGHNTLYKFPCYGGLGFAPVVATVWYIQSPNRRPEPLSFAIPRYRIDDGADVVVTGIETDYILLDSDFDPVAMSISGAKEVGTGVWRYNGYGPFELMRFEVNVDASAEPNPIVIINYQ